MEAKPIEISEATYRRLLEEEDDMEQTQSIQQLAESYRERFTMIERGEDTIWTRKDSDDEVAMELIAATHDDRDMSPDDYRYEFTVDALDMIIEADEDADLDELAFEIEADVYTHDLTTWLGSRADRYAWVDEAREAFGHGESVTDDIMAGQAAEKRHVYQIVLNFLFEEVDV